MNRYCPRGFTLIELIIGLTLISIALALAFASLRFATRSIERTTDLVDQLEELRIVRSVAQTYLAQARPLREETNEPQVNFQGDNQQIEFIAPAPAQWERLAGLYRYRFYLNAQGERRMLWLDYEPYQPGQPRDWSENHETTLLMGDIAAGEFSYFGVTTEGGEEWHSQWRGAERLPRMVRIILRRDLSEGQQALELMVTLPMERVR